MMPFLSVSPSLVYLLEALIMSEKVIIRIAEPMSFPPSRLMDNFSAAGMSGMSNMPARKHPAYL